MDVPDRPFNVEQVFGKKSYVAVKGTIDGYPYKGSLMPMGDGSHYLGIRKEIRDAIGKSTGSPVNVHMEIDTEERTVVVPDDLTQALETNQSAKAAFDKLSYSHRKEYVDWIEGAKKPEPAPAASRKRW